jgi:hypothetical protein
LPSDSTNITPLSIRLEVKVEDKIIQYRFVNLVSVYTNWRYV